MTGGVMGRMLHMQACSQLVCTLHAEEARMNVVVALQKPLVNATSCAELPDTTDSVS